MSRAVASAALMIAAWVRAALVVPPVRAIGINGMEHPCRAPDCEQAVEVNLVDLLRLVTSHPRALPKAIAAITVSVPDSWPSRFSSASLWAGPEEDRSRKRSTLRIQGRGNPGTPVAR